jgi:hypothetical protein
MNTMAWVAIATSLATQVFTVVWWAVRRPIGRVDRLEVAVFGETGVNMRMQKFATADFVERKFVELQTAMRGISEEGERREDRIIKAINEQTRMVAEQLSETREDVRQQSRRVDELMTRSNGNR